MQIHLAYYPTVLVLLMAISMRIQITLNVNPAFLNAIIALIMIPAFLVLAILNGIIVVQHLNATAHQDHSAIFHSKLIA
jgi:hypothetical protein